MPTVCLIALDHDSPSVKVGPAGKLVQVYADCQNCTIREHTIYLSTNLSFTVELQPYLYVISVIKSALWSSTIAIKSSYTLISLLLLKIVDHFVDIEVDHGAIPVVLS